MRPVSIGDIIVEATPLAARGNLLLRILLINPNTTASVTDLIVAYTRSIAGDQATFSPVTARFGPRYIASRAAAAIAAHAALDALAEHVVGYDAVYLACFGDPGLAALKEVSPVPIVGMAEAACRAASKSGHRFSIVTGGVRWKPMLQEYVASLGLANELASIRVIAPTGDQIASDPDAAMAALASACDACARDDAAEAVILGGAALAGLAARIQPYVSVPVLCSVEAGTRAVIEAAKHRTKAKLEPATQQRSIGLSVPLADLLNAGTGR